MNCAGDGLPKGDLVSIADDGGLFELPPEYRELRAEAGALAASVAERAAVADEADGIDPVMRCATAGWRRSLWGASTAAGSPGSTRSR
jgi:hypothetical protein